MRVIGVVESTIVEDELSEPPLPSRTDALRAAVPLQQVDSLNLVHAILFEFIERDRRGEKDARPVAGGIELRHHQILVLRQSLNGLKGSAAAVGQSIPAGAACDSLRDAIGVGEGDQAADVLAVIPGCRRQLQLPPPLLGRAMHPFTARSIDRRSGEMIPRASQGFESHAQIRVSPTGAALQNVALTQ